MDLKEMLRLKQRECFKMKETEITSAQVSINRRILVNIPSNSNIPSDFALTSNQVRTSKYTIFNFIPKNISEQFHGLANFYFLFVIVLQAWPQFNQVGWVIPALPLIIIITATGIKDGLEDLRRHQADANVNESITYRLQDWKNVNEGSTNSLKKAGLYSELKRLFSRFFSVFESSNVKESTPLAIKPSDYIVKRNFFNASDEQDQGSWERGQWKDLHVGDFVMLRNNERIPADLVVISTGEPDSMCYIETKNLDGETNLKIKRGIKELSHIKTPADCKKLHCIFDAEAPNPNLYTFNGALQYDKMTIPIGTSGMLLRGCVLRNTSWLIAMTIYTGFDTKIMLNSGPTPSKRSRVDRQINPLVVLNALTLVFLSTICAIGAALYNNAFLFETAMFVGVARSDFNDAPSTIFLTFFNCFIVFQNIIPIALYISLEVTKSSQSFLIHLDLEMYDEAMEQSVVPKSWNLCDDLGQIEYVFSDKTGTLTSNMMDFKKCSIGGKAYGKWKSLADSDEANKDELKVQFSKERNLMLAGFSEIFDTKYLDDFPGFVDSQLPEDIAPDDEQSKRIKGFFSILAICHTVLVENPESSNPNTILYRAQSPDEAALVTAAKNVGFACLSRNENNVEIDFLGSTRVYTILNILEFTSDRKRMSVIVLRPEGDIVLMSKGADSVIYDRVDKAESEEFMAATSEHLSEFANDGLRTLCLAYRRIPKEEYDEWRVKYQKAQAELIDRDAKCDAVADLIERNLILMGATAIEDKLQDGVPESIALLAKAGIKIWVLTGDKVETAINIGFSCNLLLKSMILIVIQAESLESTVKQIRDALSLFWDVQGVPKDNQEYAMVIDGESLKYALEQPIKSLLLELGCRCKAVLCCRVSPLQKALVVKMVREGLGAMCLAIGDGANDVSMIQEADIGIGISGKEGLQAVMASDYAITQFRFLSKLLLVHGRWAYIRSAELVLNYFYKNITWLLILFWHQFFCGFTAGLPIDYSYSIFFNTVFTFFPTMTVGVFDQDITAKTSLEMPEIYRRGIRQEFFTFERFWIYMAHGIYQSLICYFGGLLIFHENSIGDGISTDDSTFSIALACCSLLVINIFGTTKWYSWTWITYFSLFASIFLWIIYLALFTTNPATAPNGFIPRLYFFIGILIVIGIALLPYITFRYLQRQLMPNDTDILQEYQSIQKKISEWKGPVSGKKGKQRQKTQSVVLNTPRRNVVKRPQTPLSETDGFELPVKKEDAEEDHSEEEGQKQSFGKSLNNRVHRAGLFFKHLIPTAHTSETKSGGSIAYMGGKVQMVENRGFAFSHDAGMQDLITPVKFNLPELPDGNAQNVVSQTKRRRFPSLVVADRFRHFSKTLKKLGRSKQSMDSMSIVIDEVHPDHISASTTPQVSPKLGKKQQSTFNHFSRQFNPFLKGSSGADVLPKSGGSTKKLDIPYSHSSQALSQARVASHMQNSSYKDGQIMEHRSMTEKFDSEPSIAHNDTAAPKDADSKPNFLLVPNLKAKKGEFDPSGISASIGGSETDAQEHSGVQSETDAVDRSKVEIENNAATLEKETK